jgi:hypothetical protein
MLNQHMTCAIARRTWVDSDWLSNLDEILQVYVDTLCQLGQSHTCNALNCAAREPHEVLFEDLANLDAFGSWSPPHPKLFSAIPQACCNNHDNVAKFF